VVVDLKPQHARATLMFVVGLALVVFGGWGITRPDLFAGRALPIMAGIAGSFFPLVAVALQRAPRGLDALELDEGRLIMHEGGERVAVGLAAIAAVHMVEEPLGRGHPLLCLGTPGGSLIEVALMRYGRIEQMSRALREDIALGADELPSCPTQTSVRITDETLEVVATSEQFELSAITAVDFVNHLSVHGPGLVVHTQPVDDVDAGGMIEAASIMRRIAAGEHVPLPGMTRSARVSLALHIDRAQAMMPK
jgi:hypothetical protein